tara:strand:+ start:4324 stop:5121 length:798 start_codon:yes stop_codon:yes gene_type:complete
MEKIKFYCVTNKLINFLDFKGYNLAWVGKDNPPSNYLKCNYRDNIFHKEKNYSELTFHYWYWKNLLPYEREDQWVGFCQKRRYWINNKTTDIINTQNLHKYLLTDVIDEQNKVNSFICDSIKVSGVKKTKLLKRGWRNILKKPSIFFNKNYQTIKVHFDMHHGHGNLEKAIKLLEKEDREDFYSYVNTYNFFHPHIMFISQKKIISKWFEALFPWLERCEKEFGINNLSGYDSTRIYAYLSERYLSFWFRKYTNYREQAWTFIDI